MLLLQFQLSVEFILPYFLQQNQIPDHSIIQLYVKATNTYLSINNSGFIMSTANGGDKHSK